MLLWAPPVSSGGFCSARLRSAERPRLAQRLDLGGRLRASVGDDLLKHADTLLELRRPRSILRGLLGCKACVDFELLLPQREKALGEIDDEARQAGDNDQQAEYVSRTHFRLSLPYRPPAPRFRERASGFQSSRNFRCRQGAGRCLSCANECRGRHGL